MGDLITVVADVESDVGRGSTACESLDREPIMLRRSGQEIPVFTKGMGSDVRVGLKQEVMVERKRGAVPTRSSIMFRFCWFAPVQGHSMVS